MNIKRFVVESMTDYPSFTDGRRITVLGDATYDDIRQMLSLHRNMVAHNRVTGTPYLAGNTPLSGPFGHIRALRPARFVWPLDDEGIALLAVLRMTEGLQGDVSVAAPCTWM